MQTETKIIDYFIYCSLCKNKLVKETEDPCNECLTTPVNINSRIPVNFEEKVK